MPGNANDERRPDAEIAASAELRRNADAINGLHGLVQRPSAIGRSASGGAHRLEEFGNLDLETVAVARQQLRRGENV